MEILHEVGEFNLQSLGSLSEADAKKVEKDQSTNDQQQNNKQEKD